MKPATMLRTFKGFKGKILSGRLDDAPGGPIEFVIMAASEKQLAVLWSGLMPGLAYDPAGVQNVIVVQAATLPDSKLKIENSKLPIFNPPPEPDALDRLNTELESE